MILTNIRFFLKCVKKKKQSRNIRQYKFISPDFSGQKVDAISNQFVSFLWTQLFAGTACMFKSHNKVCFFFFLSSANALVSLSNTSMFRLIRVSWLFALPFFLSSYSEIFPYLTKVLINVYDVCTQRKTCTRWICVAKCNMKINSSLLALMSLLWFLRELKDKINC